MMKILIGVCLSRRIPMCLDSIYDLHWHGHKDIMLIEGKGDEQDRFADITARSEKLRQIAVAGGYDALLLADDDQIFPNDALLKLAVHLEAGADIAYGFTVWRNPPHHWSAAVIMEEHCFLPLNQFSAVAQESWGQTIKVNGVGSFCTLLSRRVLRRTTFHRRGEHNFDYYLAVDAQREKWLQVMDLSVILAHVNMAADPPYIVYPIPEPPLWREEPLP